MPDYAELHCQTAFSFLEGASMPGPLAERAAALGLRALGVCDRDGVYGMVRAWKTGREHDLQVLHGALLSVRGPAWRKQPKEVKGVDRVGVRELMIYATNEQGWGSLCELLSQGREGQPTGSSL